MVVDATIAAFALVPIAVEMAVRPASFSIVSFFIGSIGNRVGGLILKIIKNCEYEH